MKAYPRPCSLLLLVVTLPCLAAEPSTAADIRKAVPTEAYLAIYGQHNPERDYQTVYAEEIWQTIQDERLIERAIEILTSRMDEQDLDNAKSVIDDLRAAVEPVDWDVLSSCTEGVYAQSMETPVTHHLGLLRFDSGGAAACEEAVKNLFDLAEQYSAGELSLETKTEGDVTVIQLRIPGNTPFQPTVARMDDILLISSSEAFALKSLAMLQGKGGESKFDDPRLKEALTKLPEPEDALVFFDGERLFSELRGLGPFIRGVSRGDPDAARAAGLIERIMDEVAVIDYEVTVEYTEQSRNCSMALGKVTPDADQKLLGKMFGSGEPFTNWQRWIPADATSYSLSTGVNLHPLYEWVMKEIPAMFPEAQDRFDQFEAMQEQFGVHLDRDILQAFSGESVSVAFPSETSSPVGGDDSVYACRCQKPERIRELLHELMDRLQEIPAVRAQQIKLTECEELEGFEELSVPMLAMFGAKPVIGFHDGWMVIGSNSSAAKKLIETRAGNEPTIDASETYAKFHLEIDGPVDSLSYSNLAEQTRQTAQFIRQIGVMAPMILGIVGAQADSDELEVVQEVLALLPSVAKVVEKFDYLEAKLSVTQSGDTPDTYVTRTVTLVRPPGQAEEDEAAEASTPAAEAVGSE